MDDDDLAAVVRSVRPPSSICSTTATLSFSPSSPSPKLQPLFPNLTTTDALDSFLWKDYLRTDLLSSILQTPRSLHSHLPSFPFSFPSSAESSQLSGPLPGRAPFSPAVQEVALEPAASHVPAEISDESPCSATNKRGSKAQLFKRRKMEEKRVVCVPAAPGSGKTGSCIPSDLWAWRKYGQKPIKGSPYPRGYYRCSSSKGCSARKQVERSMENPSMLVITYTSDHNHPWFGHATEECVPSEAEKERRASPQRESHVNAPAQPRGDDPGGSAEEKAVTFHPQNELLLSPLEELLYPFGGFGSKMSSVDYKSDDEEENASAVDPYNLFNLSSASFHR